MSAESPGKPPISIVLQGPQGNLAPPEEVRIRRLQARPLGRRRVRMEIDLTPFQMRPDVRVWVTDAQGREVGRMDIVHVMTPHIALTLHLRGPEPQGEYTLTAAVLYPPPEYRHLRQDDPRAKAEAVPQQAIPMVEVHRTAIQFTLPPASSTAHG